MTYTVKNKRIVFMNDQKIENLLNLALEATPGERERSPELEAGYNPREETWQVIIRYSETLRESLSRMGIYAALRRLWNFVLPWQDLEAWPPCRRFSTLKSPSGFFFRWTKEGRLPVCPRCRMPDTIFREEE